MSLSLLKFVIILCFLMNLAMGWSIFGRKTCEDDDRFKTRRCLLEHGRSLFGMNLISDEAFLMTKMPQMNATCHNILQCFDGLAHCDQDHILPITRKICDFTDFLAGDFVPCYQILKAEKSDPCVASFMDVMLGKNQDLQNACQVYKNPCIKKVVKEKCGEAILPRFDRMTEYMTQTAARCP